MNNNNKEKYKLNNNKSQLSDSFTASTKTDSTPKSVSDTQISFTNEVKSPRNATYIKEVYKDNFFEEMRIISDLIDEYNYIGMDTEFPGTVYNLQNITSDFYYKTLKINVDSLKLIQLGITISNENGEYPKNIPYHTWQFNFEFDLEKDIYNEESINLLKNSGFNFKNLKKNGIKHKIFAEYLMTSGLVLNPDIYWISYHGAYDFGYLLNLLLSLSVSGLVKNISEFKHFFLISLIDIVGNFLAISLLMEYSAISFGCLNKYSYSEYPCGFHLSFLLLIVNVFIDFFILFGVSLFDVISLFFWFSELLLFEGVFFLLLCSSLLIFKFGFSLVLNPYLNPFLIFEVSSSISDIALLLYCIGNEVPLELVILSFISNKEKSFGLVVKLYLNLVLLFENLGIYSVLFNL